MISSCFGQTGDNVERNSRCYINSRRRGSLGKETEEVGISAFRSSCLFVFAYFSTVHLLVPSRVECFQEFSWRWWLGEISRGGGGGEAMEKCSESTIHLVLPVWSLCLTRWEEFARFPDNESRKLPATEVSTRECGRYDAAFKYRPNSFVRSRRVWVAIPPREFPAKRSLFRPLNESRYLAIDASRTSRVDDI